MKKKYQIAFLVFGLLLLIIMVSQLDFRQVWEGLQRAGYWFAAVMVLWAGLYILNTASWFVIIRSQDRHLAQRKSDSVPFWWLYKRTVAGFALNYATPCGLMGGEAYRIMELAPCIGTERASSSVILYVMTHIFSHLCFWLLSVAIFLLTQELTLFMAFFLTLVTTFCTLGIWFFMVGYRKGLANRVMSLLRHFPLIKKPVERFVEKHKKQLDNIDMQIAALHQQSKSTFLTAVTLELLCRFLSCLEIMFCLLVLIPEVNYVDCVLILAFTSLFANMLFFMPMQLVGREGGFLMSSAGLGITAGAGIFVALIVRVRELLWTAIGLMLIPHKQK